MLARVDKTSEMDFVTRERVLETETSEPCETRGSEGEREGGLVDPGVGGILLGGCT